MVTFLLFFHYLKEFLWILQYDMSFSNVINKLSYLYFLLHDLYASPWVPPAFWNPPRRHLRGFGVRNSCVTNRPPRMQRCAASSWRLGQRWRMMNWPMVSNIFYFHPENWGRFPIWLIFFNWVETTNQIKLLVTWKFCEPYLGNPPGNDHRSHQTGSSEHHRLKSAGFWDGIY